MCGVLVMTWEELKAMIVAGVLVGAVMVCLTLASGYRFPAWAVVIVGAITYMAIRPTTP